MRDSCPYEVFHSSSSLFLLQVPFFYLKDGSSPPRSHYKHCSNIFICCRGITGKGGTSSDSPFSSVSRVTLIPGPVSGVFCLALQAYQVRSGAFVSGILLFPQADGFFVVQMSANRCLKKKCRDYALLSFILPLSRCSLIASSNLFSVSPAFFSKNHPFRYPSPRGPPLPYKFPSIFDGVPFLVYASVSLVQSVQTTAVTTGNCRPCICDTLAFLLFSFGENKKRFFFVVLSFSDCGNAAVVPKLEARSNRTNLCSCTEVVLATDYLHIVSPFFFFYFGVLLEHRA